ncbi:hypothetical protein [Streptomyces mirabilis]|uniref:hypothetical protein n=1 Tax=Streptomyces mirabilis TaxID=68239 RepID=UPI003688059A
MTDISATSFFRLQAAEPIEPAFEPEGDSAHPDTQSPEAIAEWGHGSKTCPCCQGHGEHGTGYECYLCDGSRTVGKDTPDGYRCDGTLPDGGHGKTAADTPYTISCLSHQDGMARTAHLNREEAEEYAKSSVQTQRQYAAQDDLRASSPPHAYASRDEAQAHADEITTTHGVAPVTVTSNPHSGVSYAKRYPHGDSSVLGLAHDQFDEHNLLHEMAHHLRSHDPDWSADEDHHSRGFLRHHYALLASHTRSGEDLHDKLHQKMTFHDALIRHTGYMADQLPEEEQDGGAGLRSMGPTQSRAPVRDRLRRLFRGASTDTPVPDNDQPYEHEHPWLPRDHFFAPTKKGLDERLFDGDRMRPEVRRHILGLLNDFWAPRYGDSWQTWARVYLAGSEASHFYGNGDLDVLIGIDHDALNQHVDAFCGEPDAVVDERLTNELREHLNDDARMLPGPGGTETGPWESTFYVNPASYDIREIKPYAAYDITRDEWAVRPVETPDDFGPEKLPESTWDVLDALQTLIKAVAELPEGVREREGAALYDYLHADRHSAFGPDGTGLYDPANAVWKALDKAPGKPLQQLIDWKHAHDGAANAQEAAA